MIIKFYSHWKTDVSPVNLKNVNLYNNNNELLCEVQNFPALNCVKGLLSQTHTYSHLLDLSIFSFLFQYWHWTTGIVKPLIYICNVSFHTGIFPNKIKTTIVILLYKSGDKHYFTNYRPVSLLSQFSKILEKLFTVRLNNFIEKHKLLTNSQYGFRNNRSTSLALMDLIEEITNNLDDKKWTRGLHLHLDLYTLRIQDVATTLWLFCCCVLYMWHLLHVCPS